MMDDNLTLNLPEEEVNNFTITVNNGPGVWKFPVHTYFLKKHSPVFKAMLENEFLETQEKELIIRDYTGLHVQQFLKCLYFGTLPFQFVDVLEVLKIADKYEVTSVLQKCNDYFVQELKLDNVLQLLEVSDSHRLKTLEEKCLELLFNIAFFFLETESFVNLPQSRVKDLLSAETLNVVAEWQVLRAALRWLKYNKHWLDIASRSELLKLVRWDFIKESKYLEMLGTECLPIDVVGDVKYLMRVPKRISLIPFSKSLCFDDYASSQSIQLSAKVKTTGLKLVSLEPGTVFINGFEIDEQCNLGNHNVTIYNPDCMQSELIEVRRQNYTETFLLNPYPLKKGWYFLYTFVYGNDYTAGFCCSYRIPLERSCNQGDFKFICEGNVLGVKKLYYMKS